MDDMEHIIYDENDIEDFEDYIYYYGIDDYSSDDECSEDEDIIETDIKELYF